MEVMDTYFLDFETTGLVPSPNSIVEVALRGPRPFHDFVSDAEPSSPKALAVHGLQPAWLRVHGKPGREVLGRLLSCLGQGPVRIVAHNAFFEQEFLEAWASRERRVLPPIEWVCTYRMAKAVFGSGRVKCSLGALVEAHGWEHGSLHRADEDIRLTERLFDALQGWASVQASFSTPSPVLYLAGPLRGDGDAETIRTNQTRMAGIARLVQAVLPGAALIVPHTNFLFLDESGPEGLALRTRILEACETLVARCDGLLVSASHLSEGVRREMAEAARRGIPMHFVPAFDAAGMGALERAG